MPDELGSYSQHSARWREVLRKNNFRSKLIIAIFIAIYVALGLFIDLYIKSIHYPGASYAAILHALLTGILVPYATIICVIVAVVSLLVTFSMYDKIMLLGTDYKLIDGSSQQLEEKQLHNILEEMRVAAGMRYTPRLYIIEANYMNAFASGYSEKSAMVAITRGLMQKLSRDETTAVIAHELSHIRHGDIKLALMASVLSNLLLIMIDILFYGVLFSGGRRSEREGNGRGGAGGLVIVIIVLRYLLPLITALLTLFLSRSREYMADAGCVELTRDNQPLARALLKIHEDTVSHKEDYNAEYSRTAHENVRRASYICDPTQAGIKPAGAMLDLFSTHPALKKRLSALGFKQK